MLRIAQRGIAIAVVCPSVTLRYRDHVRWNTCTSKIISRLVSAGCSLFVDPQIIDLLQSEHPKFWPG